MSLLPVVTTSKSAECSWSEKVQYIKGIDMTLSCYMACVVADRKSKMELLSTSLSSAYSDE